MPGAPPGMPPPGVGAPPGAEAGAAPGGEGDMSPDQAHQVLQQLGITDAAIPLVAKALMTILGAGGGGPPPGAGGPPPMGM